jgi:hypothetical protein
MEPNRRSSEIQAIRMKVRGCRKLTLVLMGRLPHQKTSLFLFFFLAGLGGLSGGDDLFGLELGHEIVVVELHGE